MPPDHDPSFDPEFRAGDRIRTEIGEFEVQQVLGTGGMGVVYQVVRDERHGGRQFAIKTILPELLNRREVVERFEAEGRVLAKFDQENIIKIDGIFTMLSEPPRPFILMELLQGYTLRYVMDQYDEPLSVNDVCTVAIGVSNALEEIHKHGVVHRDIKPENIFIQKRRKHTRVVLIDFGIMKLILGAGGKHTTRFFLGSYSNASPEQLLGKEVTPRSDFYSLGTALYEMLTGGPLFPDLTESRAIGQAHVDRLPVPLHERAPQIPREIADIVMRALEKDPSARPKDAHAFRQPFTTARNRLLRDQAQSAGHSTIERFLANTVGAERVPPVASMNPGQTLRLPVIGADLPDTTAPSDPPYGGTQPDGPVESTGASVAAALITQPLANKSGRPPGQRLAAALETQPMKGAKPPGESTAAALVTRPDKAARPVLEGSPTVIVSDAPADWEAPSGLAAIPIQPPANLPAGPGTDPTSTRDLPTRTAPPGVVRLRTEGEERIVLPLRRGPRLPRVLMAVAVCTALLTGSLFVRRALEHRGAPSPSAETVQAVLPPPRDLAPAVQPAPVVSQNAPSAVAPVASASAPTSVPEPPAPAHTAPPPAPPRPGAHSLRPSPSPSPSSSSFVNLFEDISARPAPSASPSASATPKLPGAGF